MLRGEQFYKLYINRLRQRRRQCQLTVVECLVDSWIRPTRCCATPAWKLTVCCTRLAASTCCSDYCATIVVWCARCSRSWGYPTRWLRICWLSTSVLPSGTTMRHHPNARSRRSPGISWRRPATWRTRWAASMSTPSTCCWPSPPTVRLTPGRRARQVACLSGRRFRAPT